MRCLLDVWASFLIWLKNHWARVLRDTRYLAVISTNIWSASIASGMTATDLVRDWCQQW